MPRMPLKTKAVAVPDASADPITVEEYLNKLAHYLRPQLDELILRDIELALTRTPEGAKARQHILDRAIGRPKNAEAQNVPAQIVINLQRLEDLPRVREVPLLPAEGQDAEPLVGEYREVAEIDPENT